MSIHIKKKKAYFILLYVALIMIVIGGISGLRAANFTAVTPTIAYLHTKIEYGALMGKSTVAAVFGGFDATTSAKSAGSIPVLLYHGIVDKRDRFSITKKDFKQQMFALKRAGYQTITLKDFYDFMSGTKTLPQKSFLLTFDDGRADSYENGDPILHALDFHAVMFIATEDSLPIAKKGYYVSPREIGAMVRSGRWEVGSHAIQETGGYVPVDAKGDRGNFLSSKAWIADANRLETDEEYLVRISRELKDSKAQLENRFHVPVEAFAYPFGDSGQQTVNHPGATAAIDGVISATYRYAFRQVWPIDGQFLANYVGDPAYKIKRIETPTDWTGGQLVAYLDSSIAKPVPYADDFHGRNDWKPTWGAVTAGSGVLTFAATPRSTGASAFLEGTRSWRDYEFDAVLDWVRGTAVSLVANYHDESNYVTCTFGGGRVAVAETTDGVTTRIFEGKNVMRVLSDGAHVGIRSSVSVAECLVDGKAVASASVVSNGGGIGVKIWDPAPGTAETRVRAVNVVQVVAE